RRHTRSKRDWSSDVCSSDLRLCHHVDCPWQFGLKIVQCYDEFVSSCKCTELESRCFVRFPFRQSAAFYAVYFHAVVACFPIILDDQDGSADFGKVHFYEAAGKFHVDHAVQFLIQPFEIVPPDILHRPTRRQRWPHYTTHHGVIRCLVQHVLHVPLLLGGSEIHIRTVCTEYILHIIRADLILHKYDLINFIHLTRPCDIIRNQHIQIFETALCQTVQPHDRVFEKDDGIDIRKCLFHFREDEQIVFQQRDVKIAVILIGAGKGEQVVTVFQFMVQIPADSAVYPHQKQVFHSLTSLLSTDYPHV